MKPFATMGLPNCMHPMAGYTGMSRTNSVISLLIGNSTSQSSMNNFPKPGTSLQACSSPWNADQEWKPTIWKNVLNLNLDDKSLSTFSSTKICTRRVPLQMILNSQGLKNIRKNIGMSLSKTLKILLKHMASNLMDLHRVISRLGNMWAWETKPSLSMEKDRMFTHPMISDGMRQSSKSHSTSTNWGNTWTKKMRMTKTSPYQRKIRTA